MRLGRTHAPHATSGSAACANENAKSKEFRKTGKEKTMNDINTVKYHIYSG